MEPNRSGHSRGRRRPLLAGRLGRSAETKGPAWKELARPARRSRRAGGESGSYGSRVHSRHQSSVRSPEHRLPSPLDGPPRRGAAAGRGGVHAAGRREAPGLRRTAAPALQLPGAGAGAGATPAPRRSVQEQTPAFGAGSRSPTGVPRVLSSGTAAAPQASASLGPQSPCLVIAGVSRAPFPPLQKGGVQSSCGRSQGCLLLLFCIHTAVPCQRPCFLRVVGVSFAKHA